MLELIPPRVWRPFVGGKLLDEFYGNNPGEDGHYPESWVASTIVAANGEGMTHTASGVRLREHLGRELHILVKLLDSRTRLMLQVHPDKDRAMRYFSSPYGKTEAWYVLDTRTIDGEKPYVYLGFREGVTKRLWLELFERQDITGMEECLHRIEVSKGDAFFIPGGVPHAMGSGVFFAEVQEPTDITFRVERVSPDGRRLSDDDLHQGAGFDALFDCFDYGGLSLVETRARYRIRPEPDGEIIGRRHTDFFAMRFSGGESGCTAKAPGQAVAVILSGKMKGKVYLLAPADCLPAGDALIFSEV